MRKWAIALNFFLGASAFGQGPENVLLVVNLNSKVSKEVARYYQRRRVVPARQVCSIRAPEEEEIERAVFDNQVRLPILDCLKRGGLEDRVLYIVLTKGVPLKVSGSRLGDDHASVDSELTLLYQDLLDKPRFLPGKILNPYFARNAGGNFVRFSHREFPMYLVTRLDGYDRVDVQGLIDRALSPSSEGQFILDQSSDEMAPGNTMLRQAAERLKAESIPASRITLETSKTFLTGQQNVLGYASWGSNDTSDHSRFLKNTWAPGALLAEFVSTDARTFQKPPERWNIGKWTDPPATLFAGSPQSLIADYLHEGVTGAAGNAYEPYLDACVRPQVLFPAYVRGLNLAESYYAATPYLSWQAVVVGDPLTAPFPGTPLPAAEADPPQDPATGLPVYFARWKAKARGGDPELRRAGGIPRK